MTADAIASLADLAGQLGLGLVATTGGRVVTANGVFCELTGYSAIELQAMPSAISLFSPESRGRLAALYEAGIEGASTAQLDAELLDRRSAPIPVSLALSLTPSESATVDAVAVIRDRRVERAQSVLSDRLRAVIDRIQLGILIWDGQGVEDPHQLRLTYANATSERLLDLDPSRVTTGTLGSLFPGVDPGDASRLLALCGTPRTEEFGDVASGAGVRGRRLFRWQGLGLAGDMVASAFEDVTTQRAGESRRRELLHQLVEISDEERRRLAMDLHDDAVQQAAAAAILIEGLRRRPDQHDLDDRLAAAERALRTALEGLRRFVFELSPPELVESGLDSAIRSVADHLFSETEVAVHVEFAVTDDVSPSVQTAAYRIVAEALTNARKHAEASRVEVQVNSRADVLHLTVVDDGIGLHGSVVPGHIGVDSMQRRAAGEGGSCSIVSNGRAKGTTVEATLPMRGRPDDPRASEVAKPPAEDELAALREELDSMSAAAGDARRSAWRSRHQLRTAMTMVDALLAPGGTAASAAQVGADLLGRALEAGSAIFLLDQDGLRLDRVASWHADPKQLSTLDSGTFVTGSPLLSHARTVLMSGVPLVAELDVASSDDGPRSPPHFEAHSAIVAPLAARGRTLGTVCLVRDQTPDAFTGDDVEFVMCAATQIALAVLRSGDATPR